LIWDLCTQPSNEDRDASLVAGSHISGSTGGNKKLNYR